MFSRKTIIEAFTLAENLKSHAELNNFIFKHGLEDADISGVSKTARLTSIAKYLVSKNDEHLTYEVVSEIIDEEIKRLQRINGFSYKENLSFDSEHPSLYLLLKQDGFDIENNQLQRLLPNSLNIKGSKEEIFILLDKHGFSTPKGHLEQGIESHEQGQWAAANGQLRTYVESLFDEMAASIYGSLSAAGVDSHARRTALARTNPPLFDTVLNEWVGNGTGLINGFYKYLHPAGPHPGLSDIEESTFRLHLVILITSHLIRRYDKNFV